MQTNEVRIAVEEKLKIAAAQRDENIKKMLDRLKEHVSQQHNLTFLYFVKGLKRGELSEMQHFSKFVM
jgi:hypothetical protein